MNGALTISAVLARLRLVPGIVLVAFVAACGGGSGGGDGAPPAPISAPVITQQPTSQTVVSGSTASFSVALQDATGASYQWLRAGAPVAGANQPSHAFVAALADSGSKWSVRVSNAAGTVTSSEAVLTVTPKPGDPSLGLSLFNGDIGGPGNLDGSGSAARFSDLGTLVLDADDTAYVFDTSVAGIRKVTSAGTVSRLVGGTGFPPQDGNADTARFAALGAVASDRARGLLYGLDGNSIRRVTLGGVVTTLRVETYPSTAGPGYVFYSASVAVGPDGSVFYTMGRSSVGFICCSQSAIYRLPAAGGTPTLVAGAPDAAPQYLDGPASIARFQAPRGMVADGAGNLYVLDGFAIRKIDAQGSVSTVAGSATSAGFADGPGAQARFGGESPLRAGGFQLVAEPGGNLLVLDSANNALRRVTPQGEVSTLARNLPPVTSMALNSQGKLVFSTRYAVRRMGTDGSSLETVAGTVDPATKTTFGVAVNSQANVFTTQYGVDGSVSFRKYAPTGEVVNFAASGDVVIPPVASPGWTQPRGSTLAIDGADNLYEAVRVYNGNASIPGIIYKINPAGSVSIALSTSFGISPIQLASNASGTLFTINEFNGILQRILPDGQVLPILSMYAAFPGTGGDFQSVRLAADSAGSVYIARGGSSIFRVSPEGAVSTFAGSGSVRGTVDGDKSQARFTSVSAMAFSKSGTLFVRDGELVRAIAPDGMVTTVAGTPGKLGTMLGPLPGSFAPGYSPYYFAQGERLAVGLDDAVLVESDRALLKLKLK